MRYFPCIADLFDRKFANVPIATTILEATYSNKQLKYSNSSTESFSQNFQHFMNNKRVALVSNTSGAHQRKNEVHTSQATVSTSRPQNAAAGRCKALRDNQSVAAYTRDISIQGQALDAQLSANQLLSKAVSN